MVIPTSAASSCSVFCMICLQCYHILIAAMLSIYNILVTYSIQKYMRCKGACLASIGADQPAEVVDDAPRHLVHTCALFTGKYCRNTILILCRVLIFIRGVPCIDTCFIIYKRDFLFFHFFF